MSRWLVPALVGHQAPVLRVAARYGLSANRLHLYGRSACKVSVPWLTAPEQRPPEEVRRPNYVVVTGITPTPLGEGKTTTALGLSMALAVRRGRRAVCCVRQPSQGPTFGAKGGAHGGGRSCVADGEALNLHCTGDGHAVVAAHNLVAAALAARVQHERSTPSDAVWLARLCGPRGQLSRAQQRRVAALFPASRPVPTTLAGAQGVLSPAQLREFARLDVDEQSLGWWPRVLDTHDRALRGRFEVAAASELMAVLALSTSYADLHARVARTVVARSVRGGRPVTVDDLCATGAVCALLRDAMMPTLVASREQTPVLVHAGPFANIAHGCSSVLADWLAADMVGPRGFVVTEAGFGADIGFEKLCDIKTRVSGMVPDCAVLVATVRALKMHGGGASGGAAAVVRGTETNLRRHLATTARVFGVPTVVALNRHAADTPEELAAARRAALKVGADDCVVCTHYHDGSRGAVGLARAVEAACARSKSSNRRNFRFLYDLASPLRAKIESVARGAYGAGSVRFSTRAEQQLAELEQTGAARGMPVCVGKSPIFLSAWANGKGGPFGFLVPFRELRLRAGAGFVTAFVGDVATMPALPSRPVFFDVGFDPHTGRISGICDT